MDFENGFKVHSTYPLSGLLFHGVLFQNCAGHAYFRTHEVFENSLERHIANDFLKPNVDDIIFLASIKCSKKCIHCQQLLEMASKITQQILSQGFFFSAFSFESACHAYFGTHEVL